MENEQINVILEKEELTPSQFASIIGIQRAQVSHLQSNRNRVSLDIVKRIHAAFPSISTEWLLTGNGSYYTDDIVLSTDQSPAETVPKERTLFDNMASDEAPEETSLPAENLKKSSVDTDNRDFYKENRSEIPQNNVQNVAIQRIECEKQQGRNIVEIKIFYDDSTYETFEKV